LNFMHLYWGVPHWIFCHLDWAPKHF
jgi:hypothetical protein